ncbi:MAG: DUF349 domain-containing protein [Micrococcales bacterium]|nr:DUF349 domain-containing protein [Micrococcales bacterium]
MVAEDPADSPVEENVTADDSAAQDVTQTVAEATSAEAAAVEETAAEATAVEEADAAAVEAAGQEADAAEASTAEAPRPRPTPAAMAARPGPRPGGPRPGAARPGPRPAAAPVPPPVDPAAFAHAAAFGKVGDDGTVSVVEAAGERVVGQVPGATGDDALTLYVRRFVDLDAKVTLFSQRLAATDMPLKEIDQTLVKLAEELAEPAAVGDLDGLRARLEGLHEIAETRRQAAEAERAAAREQALVDRTAIVEQAEKIAGTDAERMQWRPAGDQLRQLLDDWKNAQRTGPRLERAAEDSLWKRFSHARTTFDRERRHHFAQLEARNTEAKAAKEAIVTEAEALAESTDWGATTGAYRDLMSRWKAVGRASRQVDDALWSRFRAAQEKFFAARNAQSAQVDAEFQANLEVKLALIAEAEALLPVKDLAAAKAGLRSVQARWEQVGKVPRADVQRVEARMRAVESAVRDSDDAHWKRTNPETRARAEGMVAQLYAAIASLEADLAKATAAGDKRKVADAQAALDARKAWLAQAEQAAQDSRG